MDDTCKFYTHMTNRVRRALSVARDAEHPNVKIYRNFFFLKHPHGLKNIKVYFNLDRGEFWLETSLPKALQGHNVFGSNNLEILCIAVIKLVYTQLGVKFTANEEREIREAGIRLGRLDITCSFWLESPEMVAQVLEYLYEQFRAEGKAWSAYGTADVESVYNQLRSTRVTDKYYNKGQELAVKGHSIPATVPQRQRILEIARHLLRYEVTYRGKELASLGLDFADCWDRSLVISTLSARIKKFNLQGVIRPILAADELTNHNDSSRTFYRLWAEGANLAKYRKYRTIDRARNTLLHDHQVDIYRRAKTGCPVPLKGILDPARAYYTAPNSLIRAGAIFINRR
jgi:hypothetical protein